MNGIITIWVRLLLFCGALFSSELAFAFECTIGGTTRPKNSSYTYTIYVNPGSLTKATTTKALANFASYVTQCRGDPGNGWKDTLAAFSVTTHAELEKRGFKAYANLRGVDRVTGFSPRTYCLWYSSSCPGSGPNGERWGSVTSVPLGIKREATSGDWGEPLTLAANTEILRFTTQMYSAGWMGAYITLVIRLSAPLTFGSYTCNVDNYDKVVELPSVSPGEISTPGRYTGAEKAFSYILACDARTSVSIKLEGTPLSSSSGPINNVLKNTEAATSNVGIQVLYNGNPMSILTTSPPLTVINSAQGNETLSFKAYYYYNGDGVINPGTVKAQATILFDYF
ncbi:fimbrial protein [Phytobacter ursingii]|uniref:fimbrial protein n=1 Tax=Phytobacter ursingii TaxID=1972431 RepID=UPI000CD1F6C2|nr:hypothetical protein C2U51_25260 [Enterobacteriaceae bacterium ENNIH1]RDT55916.1 fimbrial protein [Escherichia coli]